MDNNPKIRVDELRDLVKASRGIKISELADITAAAAPHGGKLVAVTSADPDGDWCWTGRIRFPFPPKGGSVGAFIDAILKKGIGGNIIINGTPHPEEVLIDFARGAVGR